MSITTWTNKIYMLCTNMGVSSRKCQLRLRNLVMRMSSNFRNHVNFIRSCCGTSCEDLSEYLKDIIWSSEHVFMVFWSFCLMLSTNLKTVVTLLFIIVTYHVTYRYSSLIHCQTRQKREGGVDRRRRWSWKTLIKIDLFAGRRGGE